MVQLLIAQSHLESEYFFSSSCYVVELLSVICADHYVLLDCGAVQADASTVDHLA